jgi:hypothetical protein
MIPRIALSAVAALLVIGTLQSESRGQAPPASVLHDFTHSSPSVFEGGSGSGDCRSKASTARSVTSAALPVSNAWRSGGTTPRRASPSM